MNEYRIRFAKAAPVLIVATSMLLAGCLRRSKAAPPMTATPVQQVVPIPSGSVASPTTVAPLIPVSEAPEPMVDLEMADAPVKLVLQRLAEIGGLQLIIPPNLNKTISVQYVRVPVSMALKDVLARAGLQLGAGSPANLPFDTVTVFYNLPANVDSMSVDAIMRRFGLSRTLAELIVKSRRP